MWLMTPQGFVSVVEKPSDIGKGTLTVRSRDKQSLEAFAVLAGRTGFKAKFDMATDYPYRTVATEAEVDTALLASRKLIKYSNFKDEAKRVRGGAYVSALSAVWNAMLKLEDKETTRLVGERWAKPAKGAKGGGYGSLFMTGGAAPTKDDDRAEWERLCDLVAETSIHALTDAEYAFYESYDA